MLSLFFSVFKVKEMSVRARRIKSEEVQIERGKASKERMKISRYQPINKPKKPTKLKTCSLVWIQNNISEVVHPSN